MIRVLDVLYIGKMVTTGLFQNHGKMPVTNGNEDMASPQVNNGSVLRQHKIMTVKVDDILFKCYARD